MSKCNFCGNKDTAEKHTDYIYRHKGHFMLFENVPCEECTFCGEHYYEAKILKKIEKDFFEVLDKKKQPARKIEMPVEVFAY
ncbi:MAG: type II toxin-antitoxin system MqsA family antitoxin [Candidatus Aminicenantes bacterium]|nr:type II toxin-antitoxin system MqsA family antitoxin [Candidatus Aminicenantes bacterium]